MMVFIKLVGFWFASLSLEIPKAAAIFGLSVVEI
jgi:hypothetical protein